MEQAKQLIPDSKEHSHTPLATLSDILSRTDLNSSEKLILMRIHWFSSNGWICYISNETLSKELGTTIRTTGRSLATLEKKGLIEMRYKDAAKRNRAEMTTTIAANSLDRQNDDRDQSDGQDGYRDGQDGYRDLKKNPHMGEPATEKTSKKFPTKELVKNKKIYKKRKSPVEKQDGEKFSARAHWVTSAYNYIFGSKIRTPREAENGLKKRGEDFTDTDLVEAMLNARYEGDKFYTTMPIERFFRVRNTYGDPTNYVDQLNRRNAYRKALLYDKLITEPEYRIHEEIKRQSKLPLPERQWNFLSTPESTLDADGQ